MRNSFKGVVFFSSIKLLAGRSMLLVSMAISFWSTWASGQQKEPTPPEATIVIDATAPSGNISPLIYGTNINYPGMVNGFSQFLKTQPEYEAAIKKWSSYFPLIDRLGPTILRFPGGLAANDYIWTYGIGPMSERTKMQFGGNGYSIIGTDEFFSLCKRLKAEAIITVNINKASGASLLKVLSVENYDRNADIAADWVEYCNAPDNGSNPRGGIDWASVRTRNGHKEPYGVTYWELGNELYDMPLEWYKKAVQIFSRKMKSVDPRIKVGAVALPTYYPQDKYTRWFKELLAEAGNSFDFWIHHMYTPSVSGKVNGFVLTGPGASVSTKIHLSRSGPCNLCLTAEPVKGLQKVALYLDGKPVETFTVLPRKDYCTKLQASSGEHTLRLVLERGEGVRIFHMMKKDDGGGTSYVDLKNSPELYYLIVAGAQSDERDLWPEGLLGGKPVYITEYNSSYELEVRPPMLGQIYSLREALNVAQYLQFFVRKGIHLAAQWELYDDTLGFGLIEGVGFDPNHKGVMGRADPRPRPAYYVLKLYRDNLQGKRLPTQVTSPTFHIGPPAPYAAMGFVGNRSMDIPFINAVASLSESGKQLSVLINNLHYDKEFTCTVRLKGFVPTQSASHYFVTGADSWTNNEPEDCPRGDCVSISERKLTVSGPELICRIPPHSVSALVLTR